MTIHPDDPRLTAYVLGELSDEERAEVQRELQDSPEARVELSAIRETAELLARELAAEPAPSLTDGLRDRIASTAREQAGTEGATAGLSSSAHANLDHNSIPASTQPHSDGIVKPGASAPGKFARISYESPAGATSDSAHGTAAPLGLDGMYAGLSPGAHAPGYTTAPVPGDREAPIDKDVSPSPSGASGARRDRVANAGAVAKTSRSNPRRRRLLITLSVAASWVVVAVSAYLIGASEPDRPKVANQP
jgi:anti-sigma factor RsiW